MSTTTDANFPYGNPWDEAGNLTSQWRSFFLALLTRTGGSGTPTDITGLQQQVIAQDVEINTAVPIQPKPVLIGEGVVSVQRPQQPDLSQQMVYQPPGAYLTSAPVIGIGQTLQNLTASRVLGTVYTNATAKPIFLYFSGITAGANGVAVLQFNASSTLQVSSTTSSLSGGFVGLQCLIPAGATYSISVTGGGAPSINQWLELR